MILPGILEQKSFTSTTNALLLVGFDGSFVDESSYNRSVSTFGGISTSTTQVDYGTESGLFDGSDDYITYPYSDDFNFGDGSAGETVQNFSVQFSVYPDTFPSSGFYELVEWGKPGAGGAFGGETSGWRIRLYETGQIVVYAGDLENDGSSNFILQETVNSLTLSTWNFISVIHNGSVFEVWFDGVQETLQDFSGSYTNTDTQVCNFNQGSLPLIIGNNNADGSYFDGYLDELRIAPEAVDGSIVPSTKFPR